MPFASMMRNHGALLLELDLACAAIWRGDRDIRDLDDTACKGYSSIVCVQSPCYWEHLSAMIAEEQMQDEYLSRHCMRVSENRYSLQIEVADSDNVRRVCTPPHGEDRHDLEVAPPLRALVVGYMKFSSSVKNAVIDIQ